MQTFNHSFFLKTIMLVLALTVAGTVKAQEQNAKPRLKMGIKASWLYCTPKVESSAPSNFLLGGFNSRNGYDIGFFVGKDLGSRFHMNAQIGNSLQGRTWEGTAYNHFLLYSEMSLAAKVLYPISVEAGLRAGAMIAGSDHYTSNDARPDFGFRMGIKVSVFKNANIHLDFMRSFNSFYNIGLPAGDYSVRRRSIGAGLSYAF